MTDTEKAKETVEDFYQAIKDFDIDNFYKYVPKDKIEKIKEEDLVKGEELERSKQLLSLTHVKYKSGEIKEGSDSGVLTYTITALDFENLLDELMSVKITDSGEPDLSKINWEKVATRDVDRDIKLIKDKDNWIIANPLEVMEYLIISDDLIDNSENDVEL